MKASKCKYTVSESAAPCCWLLVTASDVNKTGQAVYDSFASGPVLADS